MPTDASEGTRRWHLPTVAAAFFGVVGGVQLAQGAMLSAATDFVFAGALLLSRHARAGSPPAVRIAAYVMFLTAIVLIVLRVAKR